MSLLIKNGIIGDSEKSFRADVLVEGEKITDIGENISRDGAEVVDAEGCYVIPGGIDPHTHVILSGAHAKVSDGFRAATEAAIWGGTTTIVEHPGFEAPGSPLFSALEKTLAEGEGNSFTDFGVHMVFQHWDRTVAEELPRAVGQGFATGKIYTTYAGKLDDEAILQAIAAMGENGALPLFHAENDAVVKTLAREYRESSRTSPVYWPLSRPSFAEAEAIYRIAAIAKAARQTWRAPGDTYIVHLSTEEGLKNIIAARRDKLTMYAETCPQYLLLTQELYADTGLEAVMAPPLRSRRDCDALWKAMGNGDIDTIGTDHCSFSRADKERLGHDDVFNSPGGIPGIETRLPLIFSEGFLKGRISLEQFVGLTATNAARILGVQGKGRIAPGMDADIAIFDPKTEKNISAATLHQKVDYTPYAGMTVRGWPSRVWLRGAPLLADGRFITEAPLGKFIRRSLR